MRRPDDANTGSALLFYNLIAERFHSRPVDLRTEVMLRVKAVVEPGPVVELAVDTYAPGDRLIRITAVVTIVTIQVRKAVTEIPKSEKETDVVPVQNTQRDKGAAKED